MIGAAALAVALAVSPLPPFSETYADVPDGAPPTAAPGGGAVENFAFDPNAEPTVRDGVLTTRQPIWAAAGSYRIAHLPQDVTEVAATFEFSGWVVDGGALCLSIQETDIADADPPVPVSPLHLVVTPDAWQVDVNTEAGTGVDNFVKGDFDPALPSNTPLRMSAEVDRASQQVVVHLPDGSTRTLSDPRFGLPGRFAYVEPYKVPSVLTPFMTNARIDSWSATSGG